MATPNKASSIYFVYISFQILFDVDCLRNWVLKASNDNEEWVTIRRHKNDEALNAAFATASWEIEVLFSLRMCFNLLAGRGWPVALLPHCADWTQQLVAQLSSRVERRALRRALPV